MIVAIRSFTVVGVPIDTDDLYHRRAVSVHGGCADRGDGSFCAQCGRPMEEVEIKEDPLPGYEQEGGDRHEGTFEGLEIIEVYRGDRVRAFLAYAYVEDDGVGPKKLPDDVDLVEARDRLREALEPYGLWKPETFGVWCVLYHPWFIENKVMELETRLKQLETENEMKDKEFRAMLDLCMCSDPWPVPDDCGGEENQKVIKELLNREAREYGYEEWVQAYHEFK